MANYIPQEGGTVTLDFSGEWRPPAGDAVFFGAGSGSEPGPDLPVVDTADFAIPWGARQGYDRAAGSGWGEKLSLCRSYLLFSRQKRPQPRQIGSGWKSLQQKERQLMLPWGSLRFVYRQVASPWISRPPFDYSWRFAWGEKGAADSETVVIWRAELQICDQQFTAAWDDFRCIDGRVIAAWHNPPVRDLLHRTVWGKAYYERICRQNYWPAAGDNINFTLDYPLSLVGDKDHLDFFFSSDSYDIRCNQREPSGWRDNYFYDPDAPHRKPILPDAVDLETYIMLSTASLTRKPDGKPVPVKSLSLALDWDSCHWGLTAAVIDGDVRDLSPTKDGPIEVDAEIVGNHWHCLVDSWQRDRAFARNGRSIRGRGITAMLAAPFAPRRSGVEEQERTSVQLCNAQLEYTGWSIDASHWQDWNIPGGIAAWRNAAPIDVIKGVARAAGGFIRPRINEKVLELVPKYGKQPWLWTADDADLVLPASMLIKDNGKWAGKHQGDVVYLTGGNGTWSVKRSGTAAEHIAAEINEPLITDDIAARQRAIWELGRCGRWQKHLLDLPIFADRQPGLILPGMLLAITEPTVWFGVVTSVTVKANWTAGGLIVRQQVGMEVYCGD